VKTPLDLCGATVGVQLAVAGDDAVGERGEVACARCPLEDLPLSDELAHGLFVVPPRLVADSLGPDGIELLTLDLLHRRSFDRPTRPRMRHHEEILGPPAERAELRREHRAALVVLDDYAPVFEPRGPLGSVGVGGELLCARVHSAVDGDEVEAPDSRERVDEERPAEVRELGPLRGTKLDRPGECKAALERLTHRRAALDGRGCRALRCRDERRVRPSSR
jgi:hypothetical protein